MNNFKLHKLFKQTCILSAVAPIIIGLVGLAYPYGLPLFSLVTILMGGICIVNFIFSPKIHVDKNLLLVIFLELLYIVAVIRYGEAIKPVTSNLRKIFFLNLYFIFLYAFKFSFDEMIIFLKYIRNFTILAAVIIAALGLQKFQLLLNGVIVEKYLIGEKYPIGTSLVADYNMFSFVLLSASLYILYYFTQAKSIILKFLYLACFSIILPCSFLAGSRRTLVLMTLILMISIFVILFKQFRLKKLLKGTIHTNYIKNITVLITLIFIIGFAFNKVDFEIDLNSYEFTKIKYRVETLLDSGDNQGSFNERTIRWEFAKNITAQSNILQIFFGRGLDYLKLFGSLSTGPFDHPHNIFISHFFFSGIIGLLVLIALFIISGWYYYKQIDLLFPEFIIFFIVLLYYLISNDIIFSARPFFMHLILAFYFYFINNRQNRLSQSKHNEYSSYIK